MPHGHYQIHNACRGIVWCSLNMVVGREVQLIMGHKFDGTQIVRWWFIITWLPIRSNEKSKWHHQLCICFVRFLSVWLGWDLKQSFVIAETDRGCPFGGRCISISRLKSVNIPFVSLENRTTSNNCCHNFYYLGIQWVVLIFQGTLHRSNLQ